MFDDMTFFAECAKCKKPIAIAFICLLCNECIESLLAANKKIALADIHPTKDATS